MKKLILPLLLLSSFGASSARLLPEVDTINVAVRTIYPPEIRTVNEAAKWILEPLEYEIITEYPAPSTASLILSQPIPAVAKMHRTMPVLHALQLLIGEDNTIILDKKHRLITFGKGNK
ncbi:MULTISPECIES: hypothetical protein [unclassified Vibrio]|uniref:hypothetical protein n=1 Tax=unclassified Vibrio TaxID=2614977 RepID=UPI000B8E217B|nr:MULTISPECIES: hypothetical protein [unclassified Vibrio]NAW91694.1 hypothetical protein [Vibrio sp. V24_P1S3T111]OXX19129.1 hypothetical protein B9J86_16110 [Vibrio sp. V06_P1A73T115]OXX20478.1 hypothetical protein B9J88_13845 [Vibrio sp. V05_P4A8T149]OXX36297.1 hypothetical protein B9J81_06390 [Vibrio sp. V04_P4A5T148]OXX55116.1 hypothetical protein B9J91_10200 [Vibrio sp. V18_P1S4T112]